MYFVETRIRGLNQPWKPVTAALGGGMWQHHDAAAADAEVGLWTKTPYGQVYEFRVRQEPTPPVKPAVPALKPSERVEAPVEAPAVGRAPSKRKLKA